MEYTIIQKHRQIQERKNRRHVRDSKKLAVRQISFLHPLICFMHHPYHAIQHENPPTVPSYLQTHLLALHAPNHDAGRILGDDLIIMQHLKLLARILAHVTEERLRSARVLVQPVRHIQHDALDHDPQVVLLVVLGDLLHGEGFLGDLEVDGVGGFGDLAGVGAVGGAGHDGAGGFLGLLGLGLAAHGSVCGGGGGGGGRGVGPFDGDLTRGGRVDVQGDLAEALRGGRDAARDDLLEEIFRGRVACHAAVDDAAQEGGTAETVGAVDTAGELSAGVEGFEGLVGLGVEDLGAIVDFDAAHGEVEDGFHDGDVEGVVDVKGGVVEEFLAEGVFFLAFGDGIVIGEGGLEVGFGAADVLGELGARHLLHEAAAGVVAGVEVEHVGGFGIEHEPDGPFGGVLLLPHFARDVVPVAEFIGEALALGVEEEAAFATEGFSGKELPFRAGVFGVNEACGVHLDFVEVNSIATDLHQHLQAITGGMSAVCAG